MSKTPDVTLTNMFAGIGFSVSVACSGLLSTTQGSGIPGDPTVAVIFAVLSATIAIAGYLWLIAWHLDQRNQAPSKPAYRSAPIQDTPPVQASPLKQETSYGALGYVGERVIPHELQN